VITEYKALMEAAKVLEHVRKSLWNEEEDSPAWAKVERVRQVILRRADELLRSES
jgi:hypothetical protein